VTAVFSIKEGPLDMALTIKHEQLEDFTYGVRSESKIISEFLMNEDNIPGLDRNKTYIPKTYFGDNRVGYNIEYFNKNEVIADALKQYERFIQLSSEVKNELFTDNTLRDSQA
jgi:choline/glycine/proline betaine transport protein